MGYRKGHGAGKGVPRIEVQPWDEQGQPNPVAVATVPLVFRQDGKIGDSETARALGRKGGLETAKRTRLLRSLGIVELASDHQFHPYEAAGEAFAQKHTETLSNMFDGVCGEGPSSIVLTSAIQLSASRFLYDQGKSIGDAKLLGEASRLADSSRQSILAAYELQSREAAARAHSSDESESDIERIARQNRQRAK